MLIGHGLADNRIEKGTTEKANIVPVRSENQPGRGLEEGYTIPGPAAERHKEVNTWICSGLNLT
jgi:hypothetical protein